MAIRETAYAKGEAGYNAMVSDFSAMFDWDTGDSPTGVPYTDFKKSCGDNTYVALRILKPADNSVYPGITAFVSKNGFFISPTETTFTHYCSYTSGNGFFVVCASDSNMPYTGAYRTILGVSTCRNIISGETGWCAFRGDNAIGSGASVLYGYYLYSKENTKTDFTAWSVSKGAKIGGAVSMHNQTTGCVSDKIMVLTAIPDNYSACLSSVVFNGVPYTRVGHFLVPTS